MANKLKNSINDSTTSIELARNVDFPSRGFVQIGTEIVKYDYTSDTLLMNCTRGYFGTSAASHSENDDVDLYFVVTTSAEENSISELLSPADIPVDIVDKADIVKVTTTALDALTIVLPDPTDTSDGRILTVSHTAGSLGTLMVNGKDIAASESLSFTWNNDTWTSPPAGGGGSGITQLTGDVTAGPGSGSVASVVESLLNGVIGLDISGPYPRLSINSQLILNTNGNGLFSDTGEDLYLGANNASGSFIQIASSTNVIDLEFASGGYVKARNNQSGMDTVLLDSDGLKVRDGSVTNPSMSFINHPDWGFYDGTGFANSMTFVHTGEDIMSFHNSNSVAIDIYKGGIYIEKDATAGSANILLGGNGAAGIWSDATDIIGFTVDATTELARMDANGFGVSDGKKIFLNTARTAQIYDGSTPNEAIVMTNSGGDTALAATNATNFFFIQSNENYTAPCTTLALDGSIEQSIFGDGTGDVAKIHRFGMEILDNATYGNFTQSMGLFIGGATSPNAAINLYSVQGNLNMNDTLGAMRINALATAASKNANIVLGSDSADGSADGCVTIQSNGTSVTGNPGDSHPNNCAQFDRSTASGETRFIVYDVDSGALQRVTVGAADSGGTGFKVLRIPN